MMDDPGPKNQQADSNNVQWPKLRSPQMGLEPIQRQWFADRERQAVHDAAVAAVERDPEPFIASYRADRRSFNGRYVCADLFKEQFEVFGVGAVARNTFNAPLHNAAAAVAGAMFRRNLEDLRLGGDRVIFLSGIPGAGKTSTLLRKDVPFPAGARMVFEAPMVRISKIADTLDAGLRPEIVVLHVKPELALERTLQRSAEVGRGASLQVMAAIQGGLPAALATVRKQFGEAVRLMIYDHREVGRPRIYDGWDNLEVLRSEGNREQIEQRLAAAMAVRRDWGFVADDGWRHARGLAPAAGPDPGVARDTGRVGSEDGQKLGSEGAAPLRDLKNGRQRLVVMYGQATLQREGPDGRWTDLSRREAGLIPSGLYSLDVADTVARGRFAGPLLHKTEREVYQLVNEKRVVRHDRRVLGPSVELGTVSRVEYRGAGQGTVEVLQYPYRGRGAGQRSGRGYEVIQRSAHGEGRSR